MEVGGTVVVADLEAGLGTLTRMRGEPVDIALVVTEPSAKSLDVTRRAIVLLTDDRLATRVLVVANRVAEGDVVRIRERVGGLEVVEVPDDPAIRTADREGVAPLDLAPDSPAVTALRALAERLVTRVR